jgi:hypothetical protein
MQGMTRLSTGTLLLLCACAGDVSNDVTREGDERTATSVSAIDIPEGDGDGSDDELEPDAGEPEPDCWASCDDARCEDTQCGIETQTVAVPVDARITGVRDPITGSWSPRVLEGEPTITLAKNTDSFTDSAVLSFTNANLDLSEPFDYAELAVEGLTPGLTVDGGSNFGSCYQLVGAAGQWRWRCPVSDLVHGWAGGATPRQLTLRNRGNSKNITFSTSESGHGPALRITRARYCGDGVCGH